MFRNVYPFDVVHLIKSGQIVSVTDRQTGETLYCNGMQVSDFAALLNAAENDKANRYQFFIYEKAQEETSHENS